MAALTVSWHFWTARTRGNNTHPPERWPGGLACTEMPGSKKSLKKDQALGSRNRSQKTQRMPLKTNQPDKKKKTQRKQQKTTKPPNSTTQHCKALGQRKLCFKKCLNFPCSQMKFFCILQKSGKNNQ